MATKKINDRDKCVFVNTCPWPVSFSMITRPGDITAEANARVTRVSIEEIYEQIQAGNSGFTGTDGYGHHAAFQVEDLAQYNYLFGTDKEALPEYLSEDVLKNLVEITNKNEFLAELDRVIVTKSDKRMATYVLDNSSYLADCPAWMIRAIERKTGARFDV